MESIKNTLSFRQSLRLWARMGFSSFGGPAGQIALLQREIVDQRRLIAPERFQHAMSFCMLLPGPEAQQLATWCGWTLHGVRGGLAAGLLFVLPGALMMLALSIIYVQYGYHPMVQGAFLGMRAAVVAILIAALMRIGKRGLHQPWHWGVAIATFIALYAGHLPFAVIILAAGIVGWLLSPVSKPPKPAPKPKAVLSPRALLAGIVLWLLPTGLSWAATGMSVLTKLGAYFAQLAVVSFGGAYAILASVSAYAVGEAGWINRAQMLDGLSLAETTPGPLILVLQFVGFVAAYHHPGDVSPLTAGILAAALSSWTTFVPSFLFIFACAPMMETVRETLAPILAGITAAIVGVLASLSLGFMFHVLFDSAREQGPLRMLLPVPGTFNAQAGLMVAGACVMVLIGQASMLRTVLLCGAAGAVSRLAISL